MKNYISFTALCLAALSSCIISTAQTGYDLKRSADIYFDKGNYYSSAIYYEQFLNAKAPGGSPALSRPHLLKTAVPGKKKVENESTIECAYRLAESYRLFFDYGNAEQWYRQVKETGSASFPLAQYWYGVCLRAQAKYSMAITELQTFVNSYPKKDEYYNAAVKELANCRFIEQQYADSGRYQVRIAKLIGGVNQGGANYAPAWLDAGTFAFTSSRADSIAKKGTNPYTNRLYLAMLSDSGLVEVQKAPIEDPSDIQQGAAAFTSDGNRMYLTRWKTVAGTNWSTLFFSEKKNGQWTAPEKLSERINKEGFNARQPFVTRDNRILLFSSDMPGGSGGYDIWYCLLDEAGMPGTPMNMGLSVNSPGHEQAPFFHQGSNSLVFSSNGRTGMGGFDLYQSTGDFHNWSQPENLGYPMNSTKDDIYFCAKEGNYLLKEAWFSSDRNSVCCLELYQARRLNLNITGTILDCKNGEELSGAEVSVIDTVSNKIIHRQTIDATGRYSFEMETFSPVKVVAEKTSYASRSVVINNALQQRRDTLMSPDLCLTPEPPKRFLVGKPVVLKDIYYDFDKATLRPESYPVLDTLASVIKMYPDILVQLSAHTDSKGTEKYNLDLSAARAKACTDYLISIGVKPENVSSLGFGESEPIAPNTINGKDNPDGRQLNRRTECTVLHY